MPISRRVQVGSLRLEAVVGLAGVDALLHGLLGILKADEIDGGTAEQIGIARVLHPHLAHHLAADDLDVLVVDVNALLAVGLLNLLDEVVVNGVDAAHPQDVLGVGAPSVRAKPFSTVSPSFTSRPA